MSILFMFPGQGAQHPEMLRRLPDSGSVRLTLEEASDHLGIALSSLDSEEALQSTRAVQLCLLIAGVASARLLCDAGCTPTMALGLSIGAYPAAVISGWMRFQDALQLVSLRGRLMEEAYPSGFGMSAILGLSLAQVELLVSELTTEKAPLFVANINSPEQIAVAGHERALDRLATVAISKYGARKVTRIAISVPSHCVLLQPQANVLAQAFEGINLLSGAAIYISSSSARALFRPPAICDDLANNMARRVHWHDAVTHAQERGAKVAIETYPGTTLTQLSRSVFADCGDAVSQSQTTLDTLVYLCSRYET